MIYTWSSEHRPGIIPQPKRLANIDWLVSAALKDRLQGILPRDQADERGKDCSSAQRFDPDLAAQECLPYVSTGVKWRFKTCIILYDLHCHYNVVVILSSTMIGMMCVVVSNRPSISFIKGNTCLVDIRTPHSGKHAEHLP